MPAVAVREAIGFPLPGRRGRQPCQPQTVPCLRFQGATWGATPAHSLFISQPLLTTYGYILNQYRALKHTRISINCLMSVMTSINSLGNLDTYKHTSGMHWVYAIHIYWTLKVRTVHVSRWTYLSPISMQNEEIGPRAWLRQRIEQKLRSNANGWVNFVLNFNLRR